MIVRPIVCRPFIGRREELAYLRERRLAAGASRGGLVMVVGEAGVGKSRLIAEFCDSLAYLRWRVARGQCTSSVHRPYGPVLEALAGIDSSRRDLEPAESREEQLGAIVDRFATVTRRKATVLVIEDLHFADTATLDLLGYLSPRLARMRALVVVSFRPNELTAEHPRALALARLAENAQNARIDLPALEGTELQAFIDAALETAELPDATRRSIALAGEGNPFYTEELLKNAVYPAHHRGRDGRRLPQNLRTMLVERVAPLDDETRHVVTSAAVIGRTFSLELLAMVVGTDRERVVLALRKARNLQVVEEVGPLAFRFRHGLTRQAIYDEFLGAETLPLHRNIALALEKMPESQRMIEALAYHWWAAADDERSARYNEDAGDAAGRIHAHEDAIAFYERALESTSLEPSARGSLLQKVAERRLALGCTEEGWALYNEAAEIFARSKAHDREARCRANAAVLAYNLGRPTPTAALEAMLEKLTPAEYAARSSVNLAIAWLLATFGFPSRAAGHLARVEQRALNEAPGMSAPFHRVSAWIAMTVGDLERFRTAYAAWVESARAIGGLGVRTQAPAHNMGAMCYTFFGCHEESQAELAQAISIARGAQSPLLEQACNAFGAMSYLIRGDLRGARAAVEAVPPATDDHSVQIMATAWGMVVAAHLGDRAMIDKWFGAFEAAADRRLGIDYGAGASEIMVRCRRPRDAADLLHRVLPQCELIRGSVLTLLAVGRYGDAEDWEYARSHLARAADGPADSLERAALPLFDAYCLRREGRSGEAKAPASEAARRFHRLRAPLLEAAALEAAGEREEALRLYRGCGAAYDVGRLEKSPHAHEGGTTASNGAEALSAREREIGLMAASGRSNLEIARALSISHKTVEKHLATAFRKIGVSSRRELREHLSAKVSATPR
jgi:DNA-binding CsgD family transcriptional regulator/tetratricopeptide (TPR) repeat protein